MNIVERMEAIEAVDTDRPDMGRPYELLQRFVKQLLEDAETKEAYHEDALMNMESEIGKAEDENCDLRTDIDRLDKKILDLENEIEKLEENNERQLDG